MSAGYLKTEMISGTAHTKPELGIFEEAKYPRELKFDLCRVFVHRLLYKRLYHRMLKSRQKQPAAAGCSYCCFWIPTLIVCQFLSSKSLHKRIFRGVGKACGLVIRDIFDSEVGKDFEQLFAEMTECHSTVMRIALL